MAWLNNDLLKVIGWSIIHSIWQSMILLVVLHLLLLVVKRSHLRYMAGISILFATILCAVFTFQHEYALFHSDVALQHANANTLPAVNMAAPAPVLIQKDVIGQQYASHFNLLDFLTAITPYCTIGWIIGMLLYAARIFYSYRHLSRLRKMPSESYSIATDILNELCHKMAINKSIKLIITNGIPEPLTFGHIKPVILLPFSYAAQVPVDQLEMILAHELAHIKRADYFINMLQSTLEAIYFFNPFFHAISKIVRNEREYCCDDIAAAYCGNKETMAIALTNLKLFTGHPMLSLPAAPAKGSFHKRIYRLINPEQRFKLSVKVPFSTFILLSSFVIFLTKCVSDLNNGDVLPKAKDSVQQIYADNQANHKIEVFNYIKSNHKHDLLLVSSINGDPQIAYLDGNAASKPELDSIYKTIKQSRNISMEELRKIPPTPKEIRSKRSNQLNHEVDSIAEVIRTTKAKSPKQNQAASKSELDALQKQLSTRTDEIKALAMEDYKEDTKNIPINVQLHTLLTKIITSSQYTSEDRAKLNELLNQRK